LVEHSRLIAFLGLDHQIQYMRAARGSRDETTDDGAA
jgi:hypothetical protein